MIYINKNNNAIEFFDKNSKRHCIGGPAYINGDYQSWWINGKRHRIGGPSVIDDNVLLWHIEGKEYTESEYHDKLKEMGLG